MGVFPMGNDVYLMNLLVLFYKVKVNSVCNYLLVLEKIFLKECKQLGVDVLSLRDDNVSDGVFSKFHTCLWLQQ